MHAEYQRAFEWLLRNSLRSAERFVAEVEAQLELIRLFPRSAAALVAAGGVRSRALREFRYVIVHVPLEDAVFVVAIAHTSREAGYWRSRLG